MNTKKFDLEIIAGPCSIDSNNIEEIYQIAKLGSVSGARIVGLKSRTSYNPTGQGMGIDFQAIENVMKDSSNNSLIPPSITYAKSIVKDTGLMVATEIMIPCVQLPFYNKEDFPSGKLLIWNPSVAQLGWHIRQSAQFANENGWAIGLKNGKALGVTYNHANDPESKPSPLEENWVGLETYATGVDEIIFIHRGVDIPEKGSHRNALVHEIARRVKNRVPNSKLFFDPSHSYGPTMRDQIVEKTIKTMHMKNNDEYLYDGILIEAGTSQTDTNQHITISELESMADKLSKFRNLRTPERT